MAEIVAIDLGYGHTKTVAMLPGGEVKRLMFPSVAPITTRERTAEATGMTGLRTVTVNVGANNYVVGRDAYLEADANYSRSRLADYSQTDGYHALMLGALSLSGARDIDQLVIGLPLSTLSAYHSFLQEKYVGEHTIGASYAKRKVEVTVKNVHVSSQPAGAMVHAVSLNPGLRKSTNLVIDMGYFTMDFLMCEGLRPFYARSGAVQGGMSAYYDHLSALVAEKLTSESLPNHNGVDHFRLEEALKCEDQADGKPAIYSLRVGKRVLDITDCVLRASAKLTEFLDRMVTTLGGGSLDLISSVVLAGGGAKLLLPAIRERLGDVHEFVTLENSQFAIANGYAQFGVAAAKRSTVARSE
jgi:plasmid segregation protein ParM